MSSLRVPDSQDIAGETEVRDVRPEAGPSRTSGAQAAEAVLSVDLADPASRQRARRMVEELEARGPSASRSRLLSRRILTLAQADSGTSKVMADLQSLVRIVRSLDGRGARSRRPGLLGRLIGSSERSARRLCDARAEIDGILTSLAGSAKVLRQNDVSLDGYEGDLRAELSRVAEDVAYADDLAGALIPAIERARATGTSSDIVRFVETEVLFPLEFQRQSLRTLLAVDQQAALSLAMLRQTNQALIDDVRHITLATRHALDVASLLSSAGDGARGRSDADVQATAPGSEGALPGMAELEKSMDELFDVLERHDAWRGEASVRVQETLCELRNLAEEAFE